MDTRLIVDFLLGHGEQIVTSLLSSYYEQAYRQIESRDEADAEAERMTKYAIVSIVKEAKEVCRVASAIAFGQHLSCIGNKNQTNARVESYVNGLYKAAFDTFDKLVDVMRPEV